MNKPGEGGRKKAPFPYFFACPGCWWVNITYMGHNGFFGVSK
jgi:hypothetical protein